MRSQKLLRPTGGGRGGGGGGGVGGWVGMGRIDCN